MSGRGSGRGYRGHGYGQEGRGGQGGRYTSNKKKTTESKEVKFYPHTSGQQRTVTFDTVKDRIIQQVQKTYRLGVDVAESLRNEEKKDLSASEPTRELSTATDET